MRDLAPPGDLTTQASLPFEFGSVEMQYESYRGAQVGLKPKHNIEKQCWLAGRRAEVQHRWHCGVQVRAGLLVR